MPASNTSSRQDEIIHIKQWADRNNLRLNNSKSKEIVFHARGVRGKSAQPPPLCMDIEHVTSHTMLGVVVNDQLTAVDHVNSLLSSSARLLYALQILCSHGIPTPTLHDVFRATIVAKITYCAPASSGFCSAADRLRLDSFLSRCCLLYTSPSPRD